MKQLFILLLTFGITTTLQAQNLDKMNETKRRETLLKIAKATIMEYGPDFYREYEQPEIIRGIVTDNNPRFSDEEAKKHSNRSYYTVKYFYDKTQEDFPNEYSSWVFIWGDTGKAFVIYFGSSNVGYDNLDKPGAKETLKRSRWQKRPPGAFDPPKPQRVEVEYIPKKKETKDTSERK